MSYAPYRKDKEGSLLSKHNGLIVLGTMTPNSKQPGSNPGRLLLQSLREVSGNVKGGPKIVTALKDVEIN
jgi:hypothetical protein